MNAFTPDAATAPKAFVSYDYATVQVPHVVESICRDTYEGFGWKTESVESARAFRPMPLLPAVRPDRVTLKFKREQRIGNSSMVQELQRRADDAVTAIGRMERQKKLAPRVVSTALAVVGAAFLALSMFLGPAGVLATMLGVAGLVTWVGAGVAHVGVRAHRSSVLAPKIQHEKDIIRTAGEQVARMIP